jgi:hypothetical protein
MYITLHHTDDPSSHVAKPLFQRRQLGIQLAPACLEKPTVLSPRCAQTSKVTLSPLKTLDPTDQARQDNNTSLLQCIKLNLKIHSFTQRAPA